MDRCAVTASPVAAACVVESRMKNVNPASAALAWRNGTWVANGNLVPRHLGIPCVQVPMGLMADIGMPIGLTFAGRAYDDARLLAFGAAFEAAATRPGSALGGTRVPPPHTPELP